MKKSKFVAIATAFGLILPSGCTGDLPDPPGKAPMLEGAWEPATSSALSGCWVIDEYGELLAVHDGEGEMTPFGVSEIPLDGKWRPIDFEQFTGDAPEGVIVEYAAVGEAVLADAD